MGLFAEPRKASEIGLAGARNWSDSRLRSWVDEATTLSQARADLWRNPNDTKAWETVQALNPKFGGRAQAFNPTTITAQKAFGIHNWNPDSAGGTFWTDRILNDFGGANKIDPKTINLDQLRGSISKHTEDYLAGGLANSFLNKVGPIALGAIAGGALSGVTGLSSAGALPSPTSFINIGGNLIPATTALPATASATTAGGLLGIDAIPESVIAQDLPAGSLLRLEGTTLPMGDASFFTDPGSGLLGIEAIPSSAIAKPLNAATLANTNAGVVAQGGAGLTSGLSHLDKGTAVTGQTGGSPQFLANPSGSSASPLSTLKNLYRGSRVAGLLTGEPKQTNYNTPTQTIQQLPSSAIKFPNTRAMSTSLQWRPGLNYNQQAQLLAAGKKPPRGFI